MKFRCGAITDMRHVKVGHSQMLFTTLVYLTFAANAPSLPPGKGKAIVQRGLPRSKSDYVKKSVKGTVVHPRRSDGVARR